MADRNTGSGEEKEKKCQERTGCDRGDRERVDTDDDADCSEHDRYVLRIEASLRVTFADWLHVSRSRGNEYAPPVCSSEDCSSRIDEDGRQRQGSFPSAWNGDVSATGVDERALGLIRVSTFA